MQCQLALAEKASCCMRAEVITDFCVSRQFDSSLELKGYLEKYWQLMVTGDFNMVGHNFAVGVQYSTQCYFFQLFSLGTLKV